MGGLIGNFVDQPIFWSVYSTLTNVCGSHVSVVFLDMPLLSQTDLSKVLQLLVSCGDYAHQQSQQPFQVFEKGLEDYVTTVDQALDQRLLQGLQTLFPADGIITEENVATARQFQQNYSRLWFVDPIDGTDDFIHGRNDYAVMVGEVVAGYPQAGWIYAPAYRHLVWGGQDWGLFQQQGNGSVQPLIPQEPDFQNGAPWSMVIGDKDRRRFGDAIATALPGVNFISLGSFGLKVLAVIQGKAGLYIYLNGRVKLWDTTGPLALALAAGLTCCDLEGQPIEFVEPYIEPDTLIHKQPVLVGWPSYIENLLPSIRRVVNATVG
jgi:3'(2'), 5'-bisphosphate nucleotidase